MLNTFKKIGRSIIPSPLFKVFQPIYHGLNAWLAAIYYGHPSNRMITIGVTGTAGKSTTINALAYILNHNDRKTGFITTTNYNNGKTEVLNKHGISMPGGWMQQKQLREIADNECAYAIVECTSEGLAQNRHIGINFDIALMTNLSPAHLDAHGSFEQYRAAKGKLFTALVSHSPKSLPNAMSIKTISGVNLDDKNSDFFLQFSADQKFGITIANTGNSNQSNIQVYTATLNASEPQINFSLQGIQFNVPLIGQFNAYNLVLAVATADMLGIEPALSARVLNTFAGVPGRMEKIENTHGHTIIVDFACEPQPMQSCLTAVSHLPHNKLIHVFGSTGGLRDVSKRFSFGESSARFADTIIITNDDVYDSDPETIAANIREGINTVLATERRASEVITILDRREAIRKALTIAQPNDIVLITGKGSEQFLSLPGNRRIEWDDRTVAREELAKL